MILVVSEYRYAIMLTDVGALQLWLLSGVMWMSEGDRRCIDELNICYESFDYFLNHDDADRYCRVLNGTLATILDSTAQHYISNQIRSESDYRIGGKLDVMDHLTWVDGTTYTGQWMPH